MEQPPIRTLTSWLHLTEACNLRCVYCYVKKSPRHMPLPIGQEAVLALIRAARKHGFGRIKIKYAGGEPLLRLPTLLALHEYAAGECAAAGLQLTGVVLTNGTPVNEQVAREGKRLGLKFSVSLDGPAPIQDLQRPFAGGQGSYAAALKAIDLLTAHQASTNISITLTPQSLPGLPELARALVERRLLFTINFFREHPLAGGDQRFDPQALIETMKAVYRILEEHPPYLPPLGRLLDRASLAAPHLRPCGVGQNYLVIDTAGAIAACQMALDEPFSDVYDADPIGTLRRMNIAAKNPPVTEKPGCKDCPWRYWCAGGCPLLAHRSSGSYNARSPYCEVYQALIPEVVRLDALQKLKALY